MDICKVGVQKRIPTDVEVVTRKTALLVALRQTGRVHINVMGFPVTPRQEPATTPTTTSCSAIIGRNVMRPCLVNDVSLIEDECALTRHRTASTMYSLEPARPGTSHRAPDPNGASSIECRSMQVSSFSATSTATGVRT